MMRKRNDDRGHLNMRVISESQLAAVLSGLPANPRVVAGGNFAAPHRALAVLDAALAEYRLFMLNAQDGIPDRDGVILETPFVGAGMRRRERLRYYPSRLSLVPNLLKGSLPPDVVVVQTSLPVNGTVSLGIEVNILPAAIEAVRARGGLVIAQLNPQMPYTHGDGVLALEEIDHAIESDMSLPSPVHRPAGKVAREIGARVAALVPEAATLQLGIGAIPDALLASLRERRGLGVWSEMFSDGVLDLEKAGVLDPAKPITASFAFGGQEL
jgi:acyl-CoA hydrolase